ncbi:T7SS effector LXG polymorphic toxin [Enterococcus faecium]|uniref:T7SS effector LXG polymorphic toxin n=1 Tax=Enterococcus faecium TaxID=1352 RepID=UPI0021585E66|nr:T7SS effector LXG polymorphic toxin [Enterococcus faecium]
MGLIYSSSDASNVINTLNTNLGIANSIVDQLNAGSQRLVAAIDGHTMSGAAYTAGKGLFSELIIPTINRVTTAITNVQNDLTKFSAANSYISDEGYLDENNLREQLTILKSSKASLENAAHMVGTLANVPIPAIAELLRDQQREFLRRAESYQKDINRVKKKIQKLTEFDAKTKGLFQSSLDDFELAMQAVLVLNETTVNPDGSYLLPEGTDKSYFFKVKKDNDMKKTLKKLTEKLDYSHTVGEVTLDVAKEYAKSSKVKAIRLGSRTIANYSFSRTSSYAKTLESVSDDLIDSIEIISNNKLWRSAGVIGTVAGVVFDYDDQMNKYNDVERAAKNTFVHAAIDAGGSVVGAYIGGIIGSAIPIPGIGTVAGALTGAYLGKVGENIYDWIETGQARQDFDNVSNTIISGMNSLKSKAGKVFAGLGKSLGSAFG